MRKINCILLVDDNPTYNEFHSSAIKKAYVWIQAKIAIDIKHALDYSKKFVGLLLPNTFPVANFFYPDLNIPGPYGFEFSVEPQK